jgi:hypothetical protein
MTAANDLGLTTAVPARSTIYADTYPRTIEIEASAGDPKATTPVIYKLDFKRISAKTAFWAGRPAMRVVQALTWFRDERSSFDAAVNGIVRHLARNPDRDKIAQDLRDNIHAVPAWMYPLVETITRRIAEDQTESARSQNPRRAIMQKTFIEILRSSVDERRALFETVAAHLGTQAANVEKDLYVCWVLDFLFNRRRNDPIGLYFKGGTSLSKAYGLIRRFSEDIDIGIYKADLHVPLEADIAALPSVNQQQRALAEKVDEAARQYISGPLRGTADQGARGRRRGSRAAWPFFAGLRL